MEINVVHALETSVGAPTNRGAATMKSSMLMALAAATLIAAPAFAQNSQPRNLILFIPDGLRALKVTPETAPAMAALRDKGVNFKNPHSLFPTFTMANASGMSTGHHLGDTGTFSNSIYTGKPVTSVASQAGTCTLPMRTASPATAP